MCLNFFKPDIVQVFNRRRQRNSAFDIRRTSFKFSRQFSKSGNLFFDAVDHITAQIEWLHVFEQCFLTVKHPDTAGSTHFVPGKNEEITVQLLYVDLLVRYALRSVQYNHSAMFVCEVNQWFGVEHQSKHITDLSKSYDFGLRINLGEILFFKLAGFFINIDIIQHSTGLLGNSLPGNQIGVMFSNRNDDAVTFFEMRFAVGTGDQIQTLRSITRINYFTCALGIDELAHYFFRTIVGF